MKKKVLVIAPHADDESLGCGGTLLKAAKAGHELHWMLMTTMEAPGASYPAEAVARRKAEIAAVGKACGFHEIHSLGFIPAGLDQMGGDQLVRAVSDVIRKVAPQVLYLPFPGDSHSDHAITFKTALAASKWFRNSSVERILCYETISETEQGAMPGGASAGAFQPNVYSDITGYLDGKLALLRNYSSEMGEFPFPRSEKAVRALAEFRGASAGFEAAEAFQLVRERQ